MNVHFDSDKALAEQEGSPFSISSNTKGCPPMHNQKATHGNIKDK